MLLKGRIRQALVLLPVSVIVLPPVCLLDPKPKGLLFLSNHLQVSLILLLVLSVGLP